MRAKPGPKPVVERLSGAQFADAIGISLRAVAYMAREPGAPRDRDGWIFPECLRWHQQREASKAKAREKPSDLADAARRQAIAEATMAELKVARELDRTMTVEEHETELRDALYRVDAKLRNLGPRLGGVSVGIRTPAEGQSRFEPLIEEVRAELHRADDVPVVLAQDADDVRGDDDPP